MQGGRGGLRVQGLQEALRRGLKEGEAHGDGAGPVQEVRIRPGGINLLIGDEAGGISGLAIFSSIFNQLSHEGSDLNMIYMT